MAPRRARGRAMYPGHNYLGHDYMAPRGARGRAMCADTCVGHAPCTAEGAIDEAAILFCPGEHEHVYTRALDLCCHLCAHRRVCPGEEAPEACTRSRHARVHSSNQAHADARALHCTALHCTALHALHARVRALHARAPARVCTRSLQDPPESKRRTVA